MKRIPWVLLAALFLSWFLVGPGRATDLPRAPVYKVQGPEGSGSGVMLAPGVLLTAAHVAENALCVGKACGEIVKSDNQALDLAVLKIDMQCPCAPLATTDAEVDEPVVVVGYPHGLAGVVTYGYAQAVLNIEAGYLDPRIFGMRLLVTAPVVGGNSGGGVFVKRNGQWELVGIVVEAEGHITLAIPVSEIRKFLP